MNNLVNNLSKQYPGFTFVPSNIFCWSPKSKSINYISQQLDKKSGTYTLLHELSHALLNHQSYRSDLELIQLEADAWNLATKLGKNYGINVSQNHVQNCLDTYRDWLHQRSTCPKCQTVSAQKNALIYKCFNCSQEWTVTNRFCRPYRKLA
jgi:hypothetical protein